MKPIYKIIESAVIAAQTGTESHIEAQLFWALIEHPKIILCKENEETQGCGYFLYPQYQCGSYRADFFIHVIDYNTRPRRPNKTKEIKIIIEADGKEFHSTEEQIERDKKRDEWFKEQGYHTLRFPGKLIYNNSSYCIQEIDNYIKQQMFIR